MALRVWVILECHLTQNHQEFVIGQEWLSLQLPHLAVILIVLFLQQNVLRLEVILLFIPRMHLLDSLLQFFRVQEQRHHSRE